jgi:hypothetical protein
MILWLYSVLINPYMYSVQKDITCHSESASHAEWRIPGCSGC